MAQLGGNDSLASSRRKVAFITGTGHCGSTLLDLILGSHSDAFSLGQVSKIPTRLQRSNGGGLCEICGPGCDFWDTDDARRLVARYFHGAMNPGSILQRAYWRIATIGLDLYAELSRLSGVDVLIDSSKSPWWIRKQMGSRRYWRNATPHLIFVQRDGRAVVNSLLRKRGRAQFDSVVNRWKQSVEEIERLYAAFPENRRIRIPYEKLATDPEDTVRTLSAFLGVPYEPEMLRYWRHDHHLISGNAGTYSLVQRYRNQFGDGDAGDLQVTGSESNIFDREYYSQLGMAIRLDLRWQNEMTPDELAKFESIAGDLNEPYRYGDSPVPLVR